MLGDLKHSQRRRLTPGVCSPPRVRNGSRLRSKFGKPPSGRHPLSLWPGGLLCLFNREARYAVFRGGDFVRLPEPYSTSAHLLGIATPQNCIQTDRASIGRSGGLYRVAAQVPAAKPQPGSDAPSRLTTRHAPCGNSLSVLVRNPVTLKDPFRDPALPGRVMRCCLVWRES
jgi:hypothetical protein